MWNVRRALWLLIPLVLTGCGLFFRTAEVHNLRLKTTLPEAFADSVRTLPQPCPAFRYESLPEATEMYVKPPTGNFYVFRANDTLETLSRQLMQRKFAVTDTTSVPDTVTVRLLALQQNVDNLERQSPDFRYQVGIIVELDIPLKGGIYKKNILYRIETTVDTPQQIVPALTGALDDLMLLVVRNINRTLDEQWNDFPIEMP